MVPQTMMKELTLPTDGLLETQPSASAIPDGGQCAVSALALEGPYLIKGSQTLK